MKMQCFATGSIGVRRWILPFCSVAFIVGDEIGLVLMLASAWAGCAVVLGNIIQLQIK